MTDRVFQGGTADWFIPASWLPAAMPTAGDSMTIATGDGTISAADVATYGALNDEQLIIGSDQDADPAAFSADGASFGSGFTIASGMGGFAAVTFSGTVDDSGSMLLSTPGGLTTLSIAPDDASAGDLTLGGTITVDEGDSLTVEGGPLILNGAIDIASGVVTIDPSTSLFGGTINIAAGATLVLDGSVDYTTINFEDSSGTLDLVDPLQFGGSVAGFVTGDIIDLIDAPANLLSYDTTASFVTVYSGDNPSGSNPQVAQFGLTSNTPLTTSELYVGSDGAGGSLLLLSNTRLWNGGIGDWYDIGNWSTQGTIAPNSYPQFGDTAIIANGTAIVSVADFIQYGSLDDEVVILSGAGAGLSVTDGVLGPDLSINAATPEATASLLVAGTVTADGLISTSTDDSTLAISIGNDGTVAGDLTIDQLGSLFVSQESALDLVSGRLTNDGQILIDGAGTIAAGATIDGTGVITLSGQGSPITVAGSIGPREQLAFSSSTLELAPGAQFDGIIETFGTLDTIDLQGTVANYASYDAGTNSLTLREGSARGAVVASFDVQGEYGPSDFVATSDGAGGTLITDTVTTVGIVLSTTLPAPAVLAPGATISLAKLLVSSFGTSALSLAEVAVSSESPADMGYYSYWNPNDPQLPYWTLNGTAIAPDDLETIPQSEFADCDYVSGNAIKADATIQVPVALDGQGTPTAYVQYDVQNFESQFAQPSLDTGAPTPQDVVEAAFSTAYSDVPNTEDCWHIACEVAAAAGATMVVDTYSTDPAENAAGGFWRIAYAAPDDQNAVSNWSSMVQAGDILRIGWNSGGPHAFTVTAPLNDQGFITVFDNADDDPGYEAIGTHQVQYWNNTDAEDITIYRLDPADLYLVDYTANGALVQDLPGAVMQGTTFNDLIIPAGQGDTITGGGGDDVIADPSTIINAGTISDFHAGDTIDLTDLASAVTQPEYDAATGLLDIVSNGETACELQLPVGLSGGFQVANDGGTAGLDVGTLGTVYSELFTGPTPDGSAITLVTCFAAGTRIATPRGEVPVERLSAGDTVLCADGGVQPVAWIGHRALDLTRHPEPLKVAPVRILPGAFGAGLPRRPLLLSPDHAVFAEGVLIPIRYLINGRTVAQLPASGVGRLAYCHIELPRHDVLLAEALPVESYLDTGNRDRFRNGGPSVVLFPDFAPLVWEAKGYAPLRVVGPEVERVRARLARRAGGDRPPKLLKAG